MAQTQAQLKAARAEIDTESALLAETRDRVAADRSEFLAQQAKLDAERESFARDVEALRQLGLQVQADSIAVRDMKAQSSAEVGEAQRLHDEATSARADAEAAAAKAEEAMRVLFEQRVVRDRTPRDGEGRRELLSQKAAVSRSAEATRRLQLQLVQQMAHPTAQGATPPSTRPRAAARRRADLGGGVAQVQAVDPPAVDAAGAVFSPAAARRLAAKPTRRRPRSPVGSPPRPPPEAAARRAAAAAAATT